MAIYLCPNCGGQIGVDVPGRVLCPLCQQGFEAVPPAPAVAVDTQPGRRPQSMARRPAGASPLVVWLLAAVLACQAVSVGSAVMWEIRVHRLGQGLKTMQENFRAAQETTRQRWADREREME